MRNEILDLLKMKVEQYQDVEQIVSPWDDQITPEIRAQHHRYLLGVVYGEGHPALAQPLEALIEAQTSERMLTWLMYINNQPVGMANIEVISEEGIAELCRTVRLPEGAVLPDGSILNGRVNNTVVMYKRLLEFLNSPIASKIWVLQADLRLAKPITLPNRSILDGGAATQHINQAVGLNPFLLCVPRYQVHPQGGKPHQEVFFQSRLYLQEEGLDLQTPLYTPWKNPKGPISLSEIARITYLHAFNKQPCIVDEFTGIANSSSILEVKPTAGIHFSTIYASGAITHELLSQAVNTALSQSRFVEIIIPNHPESIITQKICYEIGLIPLGVLPGGKFKVNGLEKNVLTTFHFGAIRDEIKSKIVDIELAREYRGTKIEELTHQLHSLWRSF